MQLDLFRTMWGVLEHPQAGGPRKLDEVVVVLKQLGYSGLEVPIKWVLDFGKEKFAALLKQHDMKYIAMIFTDGPVTPGSEGYSGHPAPGPEISTHFAVWKAQIEEAKSLNPVLINSHSGKDSWTLSQIDEFFQQALAFEATFPIPICHETHRKRVLYSPWVVRDLLPKYPKLRLCADLSHFVVVAETNPQDPILTEVINQIAPQVIHIHGRVGYDHGPQVSDPRAPEWLSYVEGHEDWWDTIWKSQKTRGMERTTLTPEHGPPNYQQTVPYTKAPLADIFEINTWVGERQVKRFAKNFA